VTHSLELNLQRGLWDTSVDTGTNKGGVGVANICVDYDAGRIF